MFYENENMALFVDGQNFHATTRALGIDVDYKALLKVFQDKSHLLRAAYYTPVPEDEEFVAIRPLLDFLSFNGWAVRTKPARMHQDAGSNQRIKGSTDMVLAIEAIRLAPAIAHAVIFTGNREFTPLVKFLQETGTRITVVSSLKTDPVMISDDLRRCADHFIDLEDLRSAIARPAREHNAA